MDRNILLVGLGGLIGSTARYLVAVLFAGQFTSSFPLATFTVNIVGCVFIGLFVAFSERGNILSPEWRMLLTTVFAADSQPFQRSPMKALSSCRMVSFSTSAKRSSQRCYRLRGNISWHSSCEVDMTLQLERDSKLLRIFIGEVDKLGHHRFTRRLCMQQRSKELRVQQYFAAFSRTVPAAVSTRQNFWTSPWICRLS
jgi:protein CrcB